MAALAPTAGGLSAHRAGSRAPATRPGPRRAAAAAAARASSSASEEAEPAAVLPPRVEEDPSRRLLPVLRRAAGAALFAAALAVGGVGAAHAGSVAQPPPRQDTSTPAPPAAAPQDFSVHGASGGAHPVDHKPEAPSSVVKRGPRPSSPAGAPASAAAPSDDPEVQAAAKRAARAKLLDAKRKAHRGTSMSYTEFWEMLQRRRVASVQFNPSRESLLAKFKTPPGGGSPLPPQRVQLPFDPDLMPRLVELGVPVDMEPLNRLRWAWDGVARASSPIIAFGGLIYLFRKAMEEPADDFMSPTAKKASRNTGVTLKDVAGLGPAMDEAKELVEYLRNANAYLRLGAQLPAGVLMVGPPGTGKTLLARAIAGEAGVPFFFAAGSEFMEMFVGVGAARVRSLWEQARKEKPCIIFIDEFDAIGAARSTAGFGNEETANTINQLLTEMDGFEDNSGLVVLAATNRPAVLDRALTRPGRFDRWLRVPLPDWPGRVEILQVHARGKAVSSDVDWARVARACAGWSGADLESLMNEAAIASARRNQELITTDTLFESLDNLRRDPESGNMMLSVTTGTEVEAIEEMGPLTRRSLAAAAAAKALLSCVLEGCDELQKVHLFPGGNADAKHFLLPREEALDTGIRSVASLQAELYLRLAGRAATRVLWNEEWAEGSPLPLDSDSSRRELAVAGTIARQLVLGMGQGEALGPVSYLDAPTESFLSSDNLSDLYRLHRMSPRTAAVAFAECARCIEAAEAGAAYALALNAAPLRALAQALLRQHVMRGPEVVALLKENGAVFGITLEELKGCRCDENGVVVYPPGARPLAGAPPLRTVPPLQPTEVWPSEVLSLMGFLDQTGAVAPGRAAAFVAAATPSEGEEKGEPEWKRDVLVE